VKGRSKPRRSYHNTEDAELLPIIRKSATNIVAEEDDWDHLTDSQKIHHGKVDAAIANVVRISYELKRWSAATALSRK
jgi:hypothetical protein